MRSSLCDRWSNSTCKLGTVVLNELRILYISTIVYTIPIISHRMIKSVTISKKLELVMRTIDETQSVPQRKMVLRQIKGFSGKLPKDRALKIMKDFILAFSSSKDAGPDNFFVHAACRSPSSSNSLEPAHPKEGISARKK